MGDHDVGVVVDVGVEVAADVETVRHARADNTLAGKRAVEVARAVRTRLGLEKVEVAIAAGLVERDVGEDVAGAHASDGGGAVDGGAHGRGRTDRARRGVERADAAMGGDVADDGTASLHKVDAVIGDPRSRARRGDVASDVAAGNHLIDQAGRDVARDGAPRSEEFHVGGGDSANVARGGDG